jgi:colicin import membrane protein
VKSDLDRIETALLDKRAPQRQAVTGTMLNPTPSLGSTTGNAPQLSQNEIAMLKAQLMGCWNPPVGVSEAKDLIVTVKFSLNRDGSLLGEPIVLNRGRNALFQIAAESATRAVRRCQPFRLPASKYEAWQEVEVNFDPNDMFHG